MSGLLITAGSSFSFVRIMGNKLPTMFAHIEMTTTDKLTTMLIIWLSFQK